MGPVLVGGEPLLGLLLLAQRPRVQGQVLLPGCTGGLGEHRRRDQRELVVDLVVAVWLEDQVGLRRGDDDELRLRCWCRPTTVEARVARCRCGGNSAASDMCAGMAPTGLIPSRITESSSAVSSTTTHCGRSGMVTWPLAVATDRALNASPHQPRAGSCWPIRPYLTRGPQCDP